MVNLYRNHLKPDTYCWLQF